MSCSVLGVDFSGASDAGDNIWLTEGTWSAAELTVSSVTSAATNWDSSRDAALEGLVNVISSGDHDVVGLDFPFSVPQDVVEEDNWHRFARNLESHRDAERNGHPAERFRTGCRDRADGTDKKRRTDEEHRAQCPYGVRIKYQTYFGIVDVLRPLVEAHDVPVEPLSTAGEGPPTVVEVYPAATINSLFDEDSSGYKGTSETALEKRTSLVAELESAEPGVSFDGDGGTDRPKLATLCSDDALDSVLAALSAARACESDFSIGGSEDVHGIEGKIFV